MLIRAGDDLVSNQLVTESQLDEWVRAHLEISKGKVVELVYRLVLASCQRPKDRRFPLGDSIGQHGPDGMLETTIGYPPFVPDGKSFWEMGAGSDARKKATDDYTNLVQHVPQDVRHNSSFIFVTPLSGRRDWEYSWKTDAQARWLADRRQRGDWSFVDVLDGSKLIDWLQQFPAVETWLAGALGLPAHEMQTPEQRWDELQAIGSPPSLPPAVFMANRDDACVKLAALFDDNAALQLKIDTHYPRQVVDFVCAYLASRSGDQRDEALARCLVVRGADAWAAVCARSERHIILADFDLDLQDTRGARLFEQVRRKGHGVVFSGQPGGIPHPNRVFLPVPKAYQVNDALRAAGYNPERARTLAQKSDGNLDALLRCLQNLSIMPEWTQGTEASDLAVAQLLGGWQDASEPDRLIVERISGKAYGEWVEIMRELSLRPGTPLVCQEGIWKVTSRYEVWYALGSRLFDDHLERLRVVVGLVLQERDPKFDLPSEDRYLATIQGKVFAHSHTLRRGLAESLALIGSHGRALTSCSLGRAEVSAILAIRGLLAGADCETWASLGNLLPLLAEAAPNEFLGSLEGTLASDSTPLAGLFVEEKSPLMGANYMSGLLWALETLAWDTEHLTRVVLVLGELAAIDPGGRWGNRPAHSLTTILLPWYPQTCAPLEKRLVAVAALNKELPDVGWKLLLSLLPSAHQTSMETSKPTWRETIPENWSVRATHEEYARQVSAYIGSALHEARANKSKLAELLDHLDDLPLDAQEKMLLHLRSSAITGLPDADRYDLWTKLTSLVAKHRKFAKATWALPAAQVERIAAVATEIAPSDPDIRHRRLFSENAYDEIEGYEEVNFARQEEILDERRQEAVRDILVRGGVLAVLDFAATVESPWRVTFALGSLGEGDAELLPKYLSTTEGAPRQTIGSYVSGRFADKQWLWVDQLSMETWAEDEIGQFLAYLPFCNETWQRVLTRLPQDDAPYWTRASANPFQAQGKRLSFAAERLTANGRPWAAIGCLYAMVHGKQKIDPAQAMGALLAAVSSKERPLDGHMVVDLIVALQMNEEADQNELFRVEWAYLPLLEQRHTGTAAVVLERRLADDADFYCEVIRLVFRSKLEGTPTTESSEEQKAIASNAYRLLRGWRIPPGARRDGGYESAGLGRWLERVRSLCEASGHLDIAMTMAGHVFVSAPPDPDGLWIHEAVAAALNGKDAREMREGFTIELLNTRGVHGFSAGKEEEALASKYREKADAVESHGYSRLATALRELASSYDRDAAREKARDPYGD
jgi:hypothetical protein